MKSIRLFDRSSSQRWANLKLKIFKIKPTKGSMRCKKCMFLIMKMRFVERKIWNKEHWREKMKFQLLWDHSSDCRDAVGTRLVQNLSYLDNWMSKIIIIIIMKLMDNKILMVRILVNKINHNKLIQKMEIQMKSNNWRRKNIRLMINNRNKIRIFQRHQLAIVEIREFQHQTNKIDKQKIKIRD